MAETNLDTHCNYVKQFKTSSIKISSSQLQNKQVLNS